MLTFVIRRLLQAMLALVVMSVLVFIGIYLIGDPVAILASPDATEEMREQIARNLGLDRPLWQQYATFVSGIFAGDFGRSFVFGQPALLLILERMPATLELALVATFLGIFVGLPLGIYAGLKPQSVGGRAVMAGSILGFSLPTFWVGLMLIMIFAVLLGLLPASGRGQVGSFLGLESSLFTLNGLKHLVLPAVTLALVRAATTIRLARAGVREVLLMDYVKFARAKGLRPTRIVGVHVMKNIMIPIVTVIGLEIGSVVAFAVVTETIYAWPGMGKLLIDSIINLDRPVVVAYLIVVLFILILINLLVDVLYSVIDPRVRLSEQKG